MHRLQWRNALVSAQIVLVVAGAGCTDQSSGKPTGSDAPPSLSPPSALTPSTATSPDSATAGQKALEAYRSMWNSYQAALDVPDPNYPDLTHYATGKALTTLTTGIQSVKDQGLKGTGTILVAPKITGISAAGTPTEIEITDCLDSSQSHIVRAGTGPAYRDTPGGHRRTLATLRRQADGSWKVESFAVRAVGTC